MLRNLIIVVLSVVLSTVSSTLILHAQSESTSSPILSASELRITDSKGRLKATLGVDKSGKPQLVLMDDQLRRRARLGLEDHGEFGVFGRLEYFDPKGLKVAEFSSLEYGSAGLVFYGTATGNKGRTGYVGVDKYGFNAHARLDQIAANSGTRAETVFRVEANEVLKRLAKRPMSTSWRGDVVLFPDNKNWTWYRPLHVLPGAGMFAGGAKGAGTLGGITGERTLGGVKGAVATGNSKSTMQPLVFRTSQVIHGKRVQCSILATPTGYAVDVKPVAPPQSGLKKSTPPTLAEAEVKAAIAAAIEELKGRADIKALGGRAIVHWVYAN